jgi:hypothetical protein
MSSDTTADVALTRLLAIERLRRDVEAYTGQPLTDDESAIGDLPVALNLDVDYDAMYG